ncbi:uncharacterized protein LODBEIA_P29920 [Lodderomyces beijingensis]|uniref:DUF2421 domain-containing protein n=1 Tax=Lodderomyces beijingensis TaxID=1775926 RepID=A0ABP0ZKU2_9ASCO
MSDYSLGYPESNDRSKLLASGSYELDHNNSPRKHVSSSTIPDDNDNDNDNDNCNNGSGGATSNRPIHYSHTLPRSYINKRNSVILANTGERVHRSFTFQLPQDLEQPLEADIVYQQPRTWARLWAPIKQVYHNEVFRSVSKCAIAYFIASLGVFYTPFDDFLGSTDSKHIIATVAVYFHPARTKGSMNQTMIFVVISLLFSFAVSFGCRFISSTFFTHGKDDVSHFIDLLVSSVALGVVSFMKQKVNKQTFNTACSLACISIVACIVKEGSMNAGNIPIGRIEGIFQVVATGSLISFSCCYLIWPSSATKLLQDSLSQSYQNYSLVLLTLTRRFVAGEQLTKRDSQLIDILRKNVTTMQQNLEEAKYELRLWGEEEEWQYYKSLVALTISLARHLQALTSATRMQWSLLNNGRKGSKGSDTNKSSASTLKSFTTDELVGTPPSLAGVGYSGQTRAMENGEEEAQEEEEEVDVATSLELFDLFVYHLSPSIKSLVFTMKDVLTGVPSNRHGKELMTDSQTLKVALQRAILMYENRQNMSFEQIYSQESFTKSSNYQFRAEQEEVAACCGNFAILLNQFATELLKCVELDETHETSPKKPRSWPWLRRSRYKLEKDYIHDTSLHAALDDLRDQYNLPKPKPVFGSTWEKVSYGLWKFTKYLKRTDVQFGIRVGLGAAVLSVFAFIHKTGPIFEKWRLEWALTVYCIMMNKSLGGTTMTVKWRLLGTFLGAFVAYTSWNIFNANAYFLSLTGFLIAIPSFYIILFWKSDNAFGRFILLTYNLTMLYSYSMLQKDAEDDMEGGDEPIIGEIAFHRFAAVSIGIIWALTMATCFLPNSARSRLKNGLSVLWLRLGVIWNSDPLEYDPTTMTLVGFKAEEGTNNILSECETLLKQAPVEFRFKGKFPTQTYSQLIKESSAIIDAFQNLDLLIKVNPLLTSKEEYVLKYIEVERSEVEQRIFLVFYMIASAMKLGFSLPKKFASIEHAKDRMLYKLSEVRQQSDEGLNLHNDDFILLYSYILVASNVSASLDTILISIKELLGEISEDKFRLV